MTGAVPSTALALEDAFALDDKGFVKTGPDLSRDDLAAARWPLTRVAAPCSKTSLPGVFRGRRCALWKHQAAWPPQSARDRIAVSFVHRVLAE